MRLRHLVEVQRRTTSKDAVGQIKEIWATHKQLWADINPISSRDYFNGSGERGTITHKLKTWYDEDILSSDRVLYNGRLFEISGPPINVEERNKLLIFMCRELVN